MPPRLASLLNLLKLLVLLVALCGLPALLGAALNGWEGAALFAFATVLAAVAVYSYCDRIVLGMLGARELLLAEQPALHSTVERLTARAGVRMPRLYLLPETYPRILAAGRGPAASSLALSVGLLGAASPAEVEGLIAHELGHVRTRDVAVQTVVVVFGVLTLEASRLGGYLQRALLFVLAPVTAAFTHLILSPKRELAADRFAARLCESPHGLADALLRLQQAADLVPLVANPATEPLYPVHPFGDDRMARMFDTHPSLTERVRRLRALDPGWPEKLRAA
jgi:heat shock protein HtpX